MAPTLLWATFFTGATFVHLRPMAGTGAHGHLGALEISALEIFVAHGLVSLLLVGSAWKAGVWRTAPAESR